MPWKETGPMDQRLRFIAAISDGGLAMSEACRLFGVSRKSGYKWLERYKTYGPGGLHERSRAPKTTPWALDEQMVERLVDGYVSSIPVGVLVRSSTGSGRSIRS